MQTSVARRLLSQMLEGEELEESDVRELVGVAGETLYVDFKNGAELDDPKKAARTVRQYIAGFANADGGLLVVGVSDGRDEDGKVDPAKRRYTPTKRPGGQPLPEWARNALQPLAGGLVPAPRIQVVVVDGVEVLIIGVGRVPALVPCNEAGEVKYYLRMGDSTLAIPPYLISDLILGRREHPRLQVRVRQSWFVDANLVASLGSEVEVEFTFDVENESMVPATDVLVGVISWGSAVGDGTKWRIPNALHAFIDPVGSVGEVKGQRLVLAHRTTRTHDSRLNLAAFEIRGAGGTVRFRAPGAETAVPVRAALYVVANGHPPEWYQFDWIIPCRGNSHGVLTRVARVEYERPVVAWNQEWRDNSDVTTQG